MAFFLFRCWLSPLILREARAPIKYIRKKNSTLRPLKILGGKDALVTLCDYAEKQGFDLFAGVGPMIRISDVPVAGHSIEKREASCSETGLQSIVLGAEALALTALELIRNPELLAEIKQEHAKAVKRGRDTAAEIGLTGRELNKNDIEKNTETMGESKKIKMLSFKNTKFISEGHMMTMIPDEYKMEGKKFIMKDSADNQYLVEWTSREPIVKKKVNMTLVNEEKERIKQLWGYKSPESKTSTPSTRLQENSEFSDMVKKARKLIK